MSKPERIQRGRQIVKLWHHLNFDEDTTPTDTVIDMMADLYLYCVSSKINWTQVVARATKWGIEESFDYDINYIVDNKTAAQRMLDAFYNNDTDPLSVNDPYDNEEEN